MLTLTLFIADPEKNRVVAEFMKRPDWREFVIMKL
jgi:hypothetical protein